jgi:hypothetical protein
VPRSGRRSGLGLRNEANAAPMTIRNDLTDVRPVLNFEDYEADKIRRLGPDAVEPKRIKYKKFTR